MCGILFAVITEKGPTGHPLEQIQQNFDKLKHRGPDHSGFVVIDGEVFLGTHRLAITNPTAEGNQPLQNDNMTLICNGQIYNANALAAKYDVPVLRSDVDIFFALYHNSFCPDRSLMFNNMFREVDGDFAMVMYVSGTQQVVAARDPVGVRPLFYASDTVGGRVLAFASEAKALEGYANVQVFPPGMIYWRGREKDYWLSYVTPYIDSPANPRDTGMRPGLSRRVDVPEISYDAEKQRIVELLQKSIHQRIDESDQPVAFLLSGGIDSAIVACVAHEYLKTRGRTMNCFCMKFRGDRSDDAYYARSLAEALGVGFTQVEFGWDDVLEVIEPVIQQIESYDPNTIRASIPMYLLCRYLRQNTEYKVFLSGEGADELFAGYLYFKYVPDGPALNEETRRLVRNLHMFDVLRADRCFNAHGLEVRVPFLDKDLVEYVLNLPGETKMFNHGVEKYLLRESFRIRYPELVATRIIDRAKERFSDGVSFQYVPRLLQHYSRGLLSGTLVDREKMEREAYAAVFDRLYPNGKEWIIKRDLPEWASQHAGNKTQNLLTSPEKEAPKTLSQKIYKTVTSLLGKPEEEPEVLRPWPKIRDDVSAFNEPGGYYRDQEPENDAPIVREGDAEVSIFHTVVDHLMKVQNYSMLDVTKCSTTSRNIYNYFVKKDAEELGYNNNLPDMEPNLADLPDAVTRPGSRLFYIHFKHFIGENSHYFILYKGQDSAVTVLQSAVFEMSLRDWVYPEQRKNVIIKTFEENTKKIIENNIYEDDRLDMFLGNEISNLKREMRFVKQIEQSPYSQGKPIPNISLYLNLLNEVVGPWTEQNLTQKMEAYRQLFSCRLNQDIMLNEIRKDPRNCAEIKWVSEDLGPDFLEQAIARDEAKGPKW